MSMKLTDLWRAIERIFRTGPTYGFDEASTLEPMVPAMGGRSPVDLGGFMGAITAHKADPKFWEQFGGEFGDLLPYCEFLFRVTPKRAPITTVSLNFVQLYAVSQFGVYWAPGRSYSFSPDVLQYSAADSFFNLIQDAACRFEIRKPMGCRQNVSISALYAVLFQKLKLDHLGLDFRHALLVQSISTNPDLFCTELYDLLHAKKHAVALALVVKSPYGPQILRANPDARRQIPGNILKHCCAVYIEAGKEAIMQVHQGQGRLSLQQQEQLICKVYEFWHTAHLYGAKESVVLCARILKQYPNIGLANGQGVLEFLNEMLRRGLSRHAEMFAHTKERVEGFGFRYNEEARRFEVKDEPQKSASPPPQQTQLVHAASHDAAASAAQDFTEAGLMTRRAAEAARNGDAEQAIRLCEYYRDQIGLGPNFCYGGNKHMLLKRIAEVLKSVEDTPHVSDEARQKVQEYRDAHPEIAECLARLATRTSRKRKKASEGGRDGAEPAAKRAPGDPRLFPEAEAIGAAGPADGDGSDVDIMGDSDDDNAPAFTGS